MNEPIVDKETARRFVLGRQGLWPGRRLADALQALQRIEAVQVDPLQVVARSHDIALWGRVPGYRPEHLSALLYEDRRLFEYGGGLFVYPMDELPHWRLVMLRAEQDPRWGRFLSENRPLAESVLGEISARGPLGNRDFEGTRKVRSYRGGKDSALALYALWLTGRLMIAGRRGFHKVYDLAERVAPQPLLAPSSPGDAEDHFARKLVSWRGFVQAGTWRSMLQALLRRPISAEEWKRWLSRLEAEGIVTPIRVAGRKKAQYILASDLPLLETLATGEVPAPWRAIGPTTQEEAVPLAPLDIVSARGRAHELFGFDYVWEVYKPSEKRRFGYYTMPVLWGDRLVARIDPRLDRETGTLVLCGLWIEEGVGDDDGAFLRALGRGLWRFADFAGAQRVDLAALTPEGLRERLTTHLLQAREAST